MRMLSACISELDQPSVAVSEILRQLDLPGRLLSNSAGIVTCSYDFVETGIVQAVCEALPFDVVGCTTLTNASNCPAGTMQLCLSVLTSDDCTFSSVLTGPLCGDNLAEEVEKAYGYAAPRLGSEPKMAFAFLPMTGSLGGELILNALSDTAGGIPFFGMIACDFDTALYSNSFTIHNGTSTRDCATLLLVGGAVNPRFVMMSTSNQNLQVQQSVITSSDGNVLKEINGMVTRDYFSSVGLIEGNGIEGLSSVPFLVNFNDGTPPLARAIYSLNEDGSALCGGEMPEGCLISLGRMDVEDILETAEQSVRAMLQEDDLAGLIMFPCLGRNMVLAFDPFAEVTRVDQAIGGALPWHIAYSGGEICPVKKGDKWVNRFHGFTFVGCAL